MGDRVCIMSNGKVAQIGAPMDVYLNPASTFVARFLGNPPMNLMPATFSEDCLTTPSGTIALNGGSPGTDVTFGIRPEDLQPTDNAGNAVVSGQVRSLEPLGAETLIYVDVGAPDPVIVRGGRDAPARIDETIHLTCDPTLARLFDYGSGLAIAPRTSSTRKQQ